MPPWASFRVGNLVIILEFEATGPKTTERRTEVLTQDKSVRGHDRGSWGLSTRKGGLSQRWKLRALDPVAWSLPEGRKAVISPRQVLSEQGRDRPLWWEFSICCSLAEWNVSSERLASMPGHSEGTTAWLRSGEVSGDTLGVR